MSLNSAALSEIATEAGLLALLNEWLSDWFDGQPHGLAGVTPTFPAANRAFGQGAPAQPLAVLDPGVDAEIRVVVHPRLETAVPATTVLYRGKLVTSFVLLNFWVSAKRPGTGQSDLLAQRIGDLLHAILANPDSRYALAEKGVTHLQPSPPVALPSADYAKRLVSCGAALQYPIQFGDGPPVVPPGCASFTLEAVALTGTYLVGRYQWDQPATLQAAQVVAWAPQGQPVVLELEVGGALTGLQLVIPTGDPNTEVQASVELGGLAVAPGLAVRWQVVSAPDAVDTAWHCAVSMQVDFPAPVAPGPPPPSSIVLRDGVTGRTIQVVVNDGELDVVDPGS